MKQFRFPNQTRFYEGKVRDVYTIADNWLIMIASNRISAFDVILPNPIPFKGQVLNQIAAYMLNATKDICPNWLAEVPAPTVSVGYKCEPIRIEMVVRGNLTGHAWRTYNSGTKEICGIRMPEGMKENDFFTRPIITPSTKAEKGHDEDISKEQILEQKIVSPDIWDTIESYSLQLFERGKQIAAKQGLILVDTKYEFGYYGDSIYLMDEIHTPDSSRYFYLEGFEERQSRGERQKQLSKEFVREWLIENDFMGKPDQKVPDMPKQWIETISMRYIELYEKIIGERFKPELLSDEEIFERCKQSIEILM